jgi:predicted acylesterase/phospholipase RssA
VGDEELPGCDIVMKGGITSGVVYPRAITELAKRYRFRSIGGTSAGAIAAAVTAAAEHNREGGGFERVAQLPEQLGRRVDNRPFTLQLFTPDKATRPYFEAPLGFMLHGKVRGILGLFRWFWRGLMPPVLLVLAAVLVCALTGVSALWAVVATFAAILFAIVGLVTEVLLAFRTIGRNDFGIGHLGPEAGPNALTPWLHAEIQETAGRSVEGPPLTFADLWGVPRLPADATALERDARKELLAAFSRNPRLRAIDLQMMTTSLTHGRPVRLPVPLQRHSLRLEEGGGLLFRPSEMKRFFPARVVEHLLDYAEPISAETAPHLPESRKDDALHHFPIGPDLPVIVATRMSLSFPILIAAISLWELDFPVDPKAPPLKRVVFSDGGVTSNFPIHFFDSSTPTRPTFGLQLTGFEAGDGPVKDDPGHSVADPPSSGSGVPQLRADMHDLRGFLTAIKDAMQNWRDNTQSQLPGFRERIEQIKLDRGEGGLNLAMGEEQVKRLTKYGEIAGERLVDLFAANGESATEHYRGHLFARYRVTMSVIERFLGDFAYGWTNGAERAPTYQELIAEHTDSGSYAFASQGRAQAAVDKSGAYTGLANPAGPVSLDDAGVPRPPATLRSVPPT